jgi:trimethylamine--corrinoid protein Co-methyltransferase
MHLRVDTQYQNSLGLNILTQDQIEEIHFATLEVLDRVGVIVHGEEALALLRRSGARVDGERVRIPAWMVQEALASAPCRVVLSNRNGERALFLEKGRIYYGTGSDTPYTIDVLDGRHRLAVKQDVANAARITDALANIDFAMSLGLASDVPGTTNDIHQAEAIMLNTTKPFLYTAHNRRNLATIIKMAETVAGSPEDLSANPFLCLYNQPSSPLQHTKEVVEKLLYCADKRLPINNTVAVMMGATGPVTMAGSLVIANCELLSALVIHQLKARGAPFIYGGGVPPMDMRASTCSYGGPEVQKGCAALAAMGRYYDLPVFTAAGCSDAQLFDQQAGMEAGFSIVFAGLAGGNLIHDCGYIGIGMTSSMEMLAMCDEVAAMTKYLLTGIDVSRDTLALDLIEKVGPGGNFLAEEHTVKFFKREMYFPTLLNRAGYDTWKEDGAIAFEQRANKKVRDIIDNHEVPDLPANVVGKIRELAAGENV